MEKKHHPIAYESRSGMSLGEIPGVAHKKKDFGYDFFEKQAMGCIFGDLSNFEQP